VQIDSWHAFITLFSNKADCFAQTSPRHSTKIQEHLVMWLRQERLDLLKVWIARLSHACRYVSVRRVGMWWDDWLQPVLATTPTLWHISKENLFHCYINPTSNPAVPNLGRTPHRGLIWLLRQGTEPDWQRSGCNLSNLIFFYFSWGWCKFCVCLEI